VGTDGGQLHRFAGLLAPEMVLGPSAPGLQPATEPGDLARRGGCPRAFILLLTIQVGPKPVYPNESQRYEAVRVKVGSFRDKVA